jgi:hypothetical protein
MKKPAILFFFLFLSGFIFGQDSYFYKGYDYGSQTIFNPVYVIINGGFDMLQVGSRRNLNDLRLGPAMKNVIKNLGDPFNTINRYDWWNFISDEVLPLSLDKNSAQFWPNYTLHLIGGGMVYAATKEWYEYNHYPVPGLLSAATIMTYHMINEAVEMDSNTGDSVDPIADIYLFDIGGIILFSFDGVKKFFAEELNLADWSMQPSYSIGNNELHNTGQFFSMKWKIPFMEKWYLFYYFGTNGVGGLSYKFNDGSAISVGAGAAASDLIRVNEKINKNSVKLVGNVGVFYDRNNSLLASLSLSLKTNYWVNLNIYPGIIKIGNLSPGIWFAYNDDKKIVMGFSFNWLPIGLAYRTY